MAEFDSRLRAQFDEFIRQPFEELGLGTRPQMTQIRVAAAMLSEGPDLLLCFKVVQA